VRRDLGVNPDYLDRAFKTRVGAVDTSGRLARAEARGRIREAKAAREAVKALQSGRPLKPPGGVR